MTLNDKDRECIEEIAEEKTSKAVTWPVLIPIILVIVGLFAGGVWALHSSAKSDIQKQIDNRPTREEVIAKLERVETAMETVADEIKTLNALHPRKP